MLIGSLIDFSPTGTLELKLNEMLKPAKQASSCSLDQLLLKPADDVSAKKQTMAEELEFAEDQIAGLQEELTKLKGR